MPLSRGGLEFSPGTMVRPVVHRVSRGQAPLRNPDRSAVRRRSRPAVPVNAGAPRSSSTRTHPALRRASSCNSGSDPAWIPVRSRSMPFSEATARDHAVRKAMLSGLGRESWASISRVNVSVSEGAVELWGTLLDKDKRDVIKVAIENAPGVKALQDRFVTKRVAGRFDSACL